MKKTILLFLLLSAIFVSGSAQTDSVTLHQQSTSLVVRKGNHYLVDNTLMNKKAFQGFLKSQSAVSYNYFKNAHTLSNVGWGFFGGGLGLVAIGVPVLLCGPYDRIDASTGDPVADLVTETTASMMVVGMEALLYSIPLSVGMALTVASIPMLGVGYQRMHKAVDDYNNAITRRTEQPAVSLSLRSSADGVGLALSF